MSDSAIAALAAIRLTDNQREVIAALYGHEIDGLRPMDFGGTNGSHHSNTAIALSKRVNPLVERRARGAEWGKKPSVRWARGSYVYRLTPLGVDVAKECNMLSHAELLDLAARKRCLSEDSGK